MCVSGSAPDKHCGDTRAHSIDTSIQGRPAAMPKRGHAMAAAALAAAAGWPQPVGQRPRLAEAGSDDGSCAPPDAAIVPWTAPATPPPAAALADEDDSDDVELVIEAINRETATLVGLLEVEMALLQEARRRTLEAIIRRTATRIGLLEVGISGALRELSPGLQPPT